MYHLNANEGIILAMTLRYPSFILKEGCHDEDFERNNRIVWFFPQYHTFNFITQIEQARGT